MSAPNTPTNGSAARRVCEVRWLGCVPYTAALALQADLVQQRAAGRIPDQLLLLEHPHVLTLGRNAKTDHVLVDRARLRHLGVEMFEAGRGGDVTYHGPGQLVAYPILDLAPDRCDLHRYVRDLERALIAMLEACGIAAHAEPGRTGVWVERPGEGAAKVAAIGVRVARWITSHGIALNVHTDLDYFGLIVPCGLQDRAVTSLGALGSAAAPTTVRAAGESFAAHFGLVFDRDMLDAGAEWPRTVEEGVDV